MSGTTLLSLKNKTLTKIYDLRKRMELWRDTRAVKKISDFFHSTWFIYIAGVLTLLMYMLGRAELSFSVLILTGCVSLICCGDVLPCSTLLIFGVITKSLNNRDYQKFTTASYVILAVMGVIALLIRIIN